MKRRGCLRQSIKYKEEGQVEWVCGLFWVLLLAIVLYTRLQIAAWQSTSTYLEDALAASNLASALIDLEEYGRTHKVLVKDAQGAFARYQDAVRENLGLNDDWICANAQLLEGPVEVVTYIIYNVDGPGVEIIRMNGLGQVIERSTGHKGSVTAPNGKIVEHTGIYSELRFVVKGFPGMVIQARKGKLADIVAQEGETDEKE